MTPSNRSTESYEPEVGLLAALRRYAVLVVAVALVLAAAAYALAWSLPKEYTATATVTVARPDTQPVYRTVSAGDVSNRQLTIVQQLHDSRTLTRAAVALGTTPGSLETRLTVQPEAQTALIDVKATAPTAAGAADTANAVVTAYRAIFADDQRRVTEAGIAPLRTSANQLAAQIGKLRLQVQARSAALRQQVVQTFAGAFPPPVAGAEDRAVQTALQIDPTYTALRASLVNPQIQLDGLNEKMRELSVDGGLMGVPFSHVDDAIPASAPDTLAPTRGALLGGIVGLLFGCGLAWRRAERNRPMSGARVAAILGVPVLLDVALPKRSLAQLSRLSDFASTEKRLGSVAVSLMRFCEVRGLRRLVVAPATTERAGPAVALALATSIRGSGRDLLLVDLGDDGGHLTSLSGLRDEIGLRDVIAGRALLVDSCVSLGVGHTSVEFIGLGAGPEQSAVAVAEHLALLPHEALAVVDAPGLETSGLAIGAAADDSALVLVTCDSTEAEALAVTATKLELAGTLVVGVVHVRTTRGWWRPRRRSGVDHVSVVRQSVPSLATPLHPARVVESRRTAP